MGRKGRRAAVYDPDMVDQLGGSLRGGNGNGNGGESGSHEGGSQLGLLTSISGHSGAKSWMSNDSSYGDGAAVPGPPGAATRARSWGSDEDGGPPSRGGGVGRATTWVSNDSSDAQWSGESVPDPLTGGPTNHHDITGCPIDEVEFGQDDIYEEEFQQAGNSTEIIHDHVDQYFDDDVEDHQHVTEILDPRLHQIRSQRKSHQRCRRNCLLALITMGFVAIIVTVSVVIPQNKAGAATGSSTNTASDSSTTTGDDAASMTSGVYLEPMADNLATSCKMSNDDELMKLQCQEDCERADCCDLPSNFDLSCLADNEWLCFQYHQACSQKDGIADGSSHTTTTKDNIYVPKAPPNINTVCSVSNVLTNKGALECEEICIPVECCFETSSGSIKSCANSHPDCKGYYSCLHLKATTTVHTAIADQINVDCERTAVESSSRARQRCQSVCKLGTCCFAAGGKPACSGKKEDYCAQYQGCSILTDSSLPKLGDGGDNAVDEAIDETNKDIEGGDDNAGKEETTDDIVEEMNVPHPDLVPVPLDIIDACTASSVQAGGVKKQSCEDMCAKGECCNYPERMPQSCLGSNHFECLQYHKHCAVLEDTTPSSAPNVDIEPAPYYIKNVCGTNSVSSAAGISKCEALCKPAKCCYTIPKTSGDTQCRDHENCDGYAICINLKAEENILSDIKGSVDAACDTTKMQSVNGRAQCDGLCGVQKCCRDGAAACSHKSQEVCDQYSSCQNLYEKENTGSTTANPINSGHAQIEIQTNELEICDWESASAKAKCKEKCDKFACCRIPENLEASCLKGNHKECVVAHFHCFDDSAAAQVDTSTFSLEEAPDNLFKLCSLDSLGTATGKILCQNACEKAACCFDDNQLSCRQAYAKQCLGYAECFNLKIGNQVDEVIQKEVESKCSLTSVRTAAGEAICRSVCKQHTCCWTAELNKDEICYDDVACAQYLGCVVLTAKENNNDTEP